MRVKWTHAESLYKHFRAIGGVGYTLLKDSDLDEICIEADAQGEMQVVTSEQEYQSFEVQAYPKSLAPILMNWIRSLK